MKEIDYTVQNTLGEKGDKHSVPAIAAIATTDQ
jgi:hypothetical protein